MKRVAALAVLGLFVACGSDNNPPAPVPPAPTPSPSPVPPLPPDEDKTPEGFLSQNDVVTKILATKTQFVELSPDDSQTKEHLEAVKNAGDFTKSMRPITYDAGDRVTGLASDGRVSRDLRKWDTGIRNQGSRGTCTAFGTTATLENVWNRKSEGKAQFLSPEHLWSCYGRPYTQGAINCSQKLFVTLESVWPYNTRAKVTPQQGVLNEPGWEQVDTSVEAIAQAVVDERTSLVFAFDVSRSFVNAKQGIVNPSDRSVVGGHAVELVGVVRDERLKKDFGGGYFIIKNSWSATYGDKGYAYMPMSYCEKLSCYEAFKPLIEQLRIR